MLSQPTEAYGQSLGERLALLLVKKTQLNVPPDLDLTTTADLQRRTLDRPLADSVTRPNNVISQPPESQPHD
jgi:hypothetical protein